MSRLIFILPTTYLMFHTAATINTNYFPSGINRLVLVVETQCVYCEVEPDFYVLLT
jgi:hypothetical protein